MGSDMIWLRVLKVWIIAHVGLLIIWGPLIYLLSEAP